MIKFKFVSWQNFLSAGNNEIRIDLDRSKSTLIVGHNGAGKSTLLDALSFGLFGKPHRSIKKNQLINSVNMKGAKVTIEFETAGHTFLIIRTIKPNDFKIWQDGKFIDQTASARDYQKFLEQNILKLNHKSFHQIVVLGSSSFVPFMQLPAHHRREVIEDLLDVSIFGKMKNILKDRTTETKSNLKKYKGLIDTEKGKIQYQKKYIDKMEALNEAADADVEETNKGIDQKIDKLTTKGISLMEDLGKYPQEIHMDLTSLLIDKDELVAKLADIKCTIENATEEHLFYMNNDSCPTCSQDITQALKDTRVTTLKEAAKSILKTREEVISDMGENTDLIADMQNTLKEISNTSNEMQRTQALIEQLKTSKLVKKDKVDLTKSYEELKTLITAMDELRDELDLLSERLLYNDTATAMLKDTGIRTKVVREYLPAMNMLINNYLQTLDFFVSFNLDENFNETIRSRHRDTFVYANFSEGEKQRIDLSLLFAWRQIAKMKNSTNTNLLLLDETFDSSLDTDGVDNLMKILYSLDDNTNTFVISHKPDLLESKLKSKIEFKKINNFSMIA